MVEGVKLTLLALEVPVDVQISPSLKTLLFLQRTEKVFLVAGKIHTIKTLSTQSSPFSLMHGNMIAKMILQQCSCPNTVSV